MAVKRRPAKIASAKKSRSSIKVCPVTGKDMVPIKLYSHTGSNGMYWIVLEDFDGSDKAVSQLIPTR